MVAFGALTTQKDRFNFAIPYMGAKVENENCAAQAAKIAYWLWDSISILQLSIVWTPEGTEKDFFEANRLLSELVNQHATHYAQYLSTIEGDKEWWYKVWKPILGLRGIFAKSERPDLFMYQLGITGNPHSWAGGRRFWEETGKLFALEKQPLDSADITRVIEKLRQEEKLKPAATDDWANWLLSYTKVKQDEWRRDVFLNTRDVENYRLERGHAEARPREGRLVATPEDTTTTNSALETERRVGQYGPEPEAEHTYASSLVGSDSRDHPMGQPESSPPSPRAAREPIRENPRPLDFRQPPRGD
jgi:hypothetical protein